MKKLKNKKIIYALASLSLLSLSTYGIFNSNEYISSEDLSSIQNDLSSFKKTSSSSRSDSRVYPENFKTIFHNRYTQPIISMDPNNPGYLGMGLNSPLGNSDFANTIVWSGNNLFESWAEDFSKHPDLLNLSTPFTKPVVLGGIHSDEGKKSNFLNQIILLIGDGNNSFANKNMAIIRYDALTGNPIVNGTSNVLIPPSSTYPIPTTTETYSLVMVYDDKNNRYVVYHPGLWGDVKNNIFTFTIEENNSLLIQNNSQAFPDKNELSVSKYFKDDDYLLALDSGLWSAGSGNVSKNMLFMFQLGSSNPLNRNKFVSVMSTSTLGNVNISGDNGLLKVALGNVEGSSDNPIINSSKEIEIDRSLFENYFTPRLVTFQDFSYNFNVSMIIPVKINSNNFQFVKIGFNSDYQNRFHNSWHDVGLSIDNVFTSVFQGEGMYPTIWYNNYSPKEQVVTYRSNTSNSRYDGAIFALGSRVSNPPNSDATKPNVIQIGGKSNPSDYMRSNSSIFLYDYFNPNLIFSSSGSFSMVWYSKIGDNNLLKNSTFITHAGRPYYNPYDKAEEQGFFPVIGNENSGKLPSQMISDGLVSYSGSYGDSVQTRERLFKWYNKAIYNHEIFYKKPLTATYNLEANDTTGTLSGNFEYVSQFSYDGVDFNLRNKVPFSISGFKTSATKTILEIKNNDLLESTLPSSINASNVSNIFSLNNIPDGGDITWNISEPNNQAGTIKISVTTNSFVDDSGAIVTPEQGINKVFYLNNDTTGIVSGFAKVNGTSIKRNTISVADITVWEISDSDISSIIDVVDSIPNVETNVTYQITEQKPLEGSLKVIANITGGYYDPNNLGLPNPNPSDSSKVLTLEMLISGFKRINGATTINALPGDSKISMEFLTNNPNYLTNFIEIDNLVPNSTISSITNVIKDPNDPTILLADIVLSKSYDSLGRLVNNKSFKIRFNGFNTEIPNSTNVFSFRNPKASNYLPIEVNNNNILDFIFIEKLPAGATVSYELFNDVNVSNTTTGGTLNVNVTVSKYYLNGSLIEQTKTFPPVRITGLKSLTGPTVVTPKLGPSNVYSQNFLVQNAKEFMNILNSSFVNSKETLIEFDAESKIYNNFEGSLSFSYSISNYFAESGKFITTPKKQTIKIFGFKKINEKTTLVLKSGQDIVIENILPSKFAASDWSKHFSLAYTLEDTIIPPDGPIVTISSFDDAKGTVTFKVSGLENFVNERYEIVENGFFEVIIPGFDFVAPNNDSLYIIIGSSIGGLILLIIIIGLIIFLINKNKSKAINSKSSSGQMPGNRPNSGPSPTTMVPPGNRPNSGPTPTTMVPPGNRPNSGPTPTTMVPPGNRPNSGPAPTTMVPPRNGPTMNKVTSSNSRPTGPTPKR